MKKIEKKPILITTLLLIVQTLLYTTSKLIQTHPIQIGSLIDDKIPFNSLFIIIYCSWYIMLFMVPYHYYKKDKNLFVKYTLAFILTVILSNIIFIIYPTTVLRPNIQNTNIFNALTIFIYKIDTPALNCFPSVHCAISFLWILLSNTNKKSSKTHKIIITIMSTLIIISTLFTKQHVIIDALGGIFITTLSLTIIILNKKLIIKTKELLKI